MSIDYNTIMTSSSEEVEEYINRNHFTDKQKLEIYSFYNRNRKDKITVNVKKREVLIFNREYPMFMLFLIIWKNSEKICLVQNTQ
ncbi:hypothetical protein KPNIH19_05994 [Klebsiella pneumoniae subsp. pneumoniae KPNIH19]|nr:hypothetical protein KPNIH19_05994 [Klebsiella pneumoniae subsp. pneumoniae KPNIH19]